MSDDIEVGLLQRQPQNKSYLQPTAFRFFIKKIPNVNYNCQSATIPLIQIQNVPIENPLRQVPTPGTKLQYGEMQITFMVDEDLENYLEIRNWIKSIGFPEDYQQYADIKAKGSRITGEGIYSDASLMILTNAGNPNIQVTFTNLYPLALSSIQFDTKHQTIVTPVVTATFVYQEVYFDRV